MVLLGVLSGTAEAAVRIGASAEVGIKVGKAAAEVPWSMSEKDESMRGHFLLASVALLEGRDRGDVIKIGACSSEV